MLTKATTYKGFQVPKAYYEISSMHLMRTKEDKFNVMIDINVYKDDTKEVLLSSESRERTGATESQCSITSIKTWLKGLDEFKIEEIKK